MFDLESLGGFDNLSKELEFTKGETAFKINKLLAMDAFDVVEIIRTALAESKTIAGEFDNDGVALIKAILGINSDRLKEVKRKLFDHVTFTNTMYETPETLSKNEAAAFVGLDAVAIYEILGRCLIVNFMSTFQNLASSLSKADQ